MKKIKKPIILLVGILLASLFFRMWDLDKPFETADEFFHSGSGVSYYYNLVKLNFDSASWKENSEHPPVGKYIYGLANGVYLISKHPEILSQSFSWASGKALLLGNKNYIPNRMLSVLMGLVTISAVFLFSLRVFGLKTAVLSSVFLSFLPPFVAHTKTAALESPTLFFYTLSVFLFLLALEKNKKLLFLLSFVSTGLAIGTKYNNASLLLLLPFLMFIFNRQGFKKSAKKLISLFIIPPLLIFAIWPFLWSNPIENTKATFGHWEYIVKEYFLGNLVEPPFYYYFVYVIATIPALLLFSAAFYLFKEKRSFYTNALLAWILIPVVLQSFFALKQDGIRYVIMVLPPLAILSSLGIEKLAKKFSGFGETVFYASMFYVVLSSLIIHPYYLDYYNEIFGGTKNVFEKKILEVGWWGEGISEATQYLEKVAESGSTTELLVGPFTHLVPKTRNDVSFFVRQGEYFMPISDYIILNSFYLWYESDIRQLVEYSYKKIYEVKAGGAPIAYVYKRTS